MEILENKKIWEHIRKYCGNRAVRFGYRTEDEEKLNFHVYRFGTRAYEGNEITEKGVPYGNLSRDEFIKAYEEIGKLSENTVGIYATLSRFSKFPLIEKDFGVELSRFCISRDIGLDIDFGIKKISELEKILDKSYEIIQPLWDTFREKKLNPALKSSGSGWHLVAPIEAGHGDTSEAVQKLGRYLVECALGRQKFERNYFKIGEYKIEVHKDLNRVFSIPFSPYPKIEKLKNTEFENKIIYCVPLFRPDEILNFRPLTDLNNISGVPDYPEPVEVPQSLMDEACDYTEARDFENKHINTEKNRLDVSLDNLPQKYKNLENGVRKGFRDDSVCTLIGVFKTCGLNKNECMDEVIEFNRRCTPPLNEGIIKEKVRRFYSKK